MVVSLSSAEAEFYAAVKAAAAGIDCVSMVQDLGVTLQQQGVAVFFIANQELSQHRIPDFSSVKKIAIQ